jgi:hypothetical protein
MSAVDIAILLPLVPVIPVLVTWWLPWERWTFWQRVPNAVAGPYLLYCSFAAWHFHLPWWAVLIVTVWGGILCSITLADTYRRRSSIRR